MRWVLLLIAISALVATGCGGDDKIAPVKHDAGRQVGERGGEKGREADNERALAEAKQKIPEQDRITYYQLGDAGSLARRIGIGQSPGRERIKFALARLRSLHPADKTLDSARKQLIAALSTGRSARAAADAALEALNRYGGRHPAVFGLVPD